jgi:hypothetical protein
VRNLAYDLKYATVKRELRERMERMLREEGDPRMTGNAAFFDAIDYTGARRHSYDNWLKHSKP